MSKSISRRSLQLRKRREFLAKRQRRNTRSGTWSRYGEPLERRLVLAAPSITGHSPTSYDIETEVVGFGALGDSGTDSYFGPPVGQERGYGKSWFQYIESIGTNVGPRFQWSVDQEVDTRYEDFAFNWARSGGTSIDILFEGARHDGQDDGLAAQADDGRVSHAAYWVNNDFSPLLTGGRNTDATLAIYNGEWSQTDIDHHIDLVVDRMRTALTTIQNSDVDVVLVNIVDLTVADLWARSFHDPVKYERVSDAIADANTDVAALADELDVPLVDINELLMATVGGHPEFDEVFQVGGVDIFPGGAFANQNFFRSQDGIHPNTVFEGLLANAVITAFNEGYDTGLPLLSQQEIVEQAGLSYVSDSSLDPDNPLKTDAEFYSDLVTNYAPTVTAQGPWDSFSVTFDQAIDAATFDTTDVVVTDPLGNSVSVIDVTTTDNTTFDIQVEPQRQSGKYRVQVGPNIENSSMEAMTAAFEETIEVNNLAPISIQYHEGFDASSKLAGHWDFTGNTSLTTGGDPSLALATTIGSQLNRAELAIDLKGVEEINDIADASDDVSAILFFETNGDIGVSGDLDVYVSDDAGANWVLVSNFVTPTPTQGAWKVHEKDLSDLIDNDATLDHTVDFRIRFEHDGSSNIEIDNVRIVPRSTNVSTDGLTFNAICVECHPTVTGASESIEPFEATSRFDFGAVHDSVTLTFSTRIDETFFTPDVILDFTYDADGAGGNPAVDVSDSIQAVLGADNIFNVYFDAQDDDGSGIYTLTLSEKISDIYGNPLDQDEDGFVAEPTSTHDAITATFSLEKANAAVSSTTAFTADFEFVANGPDIDPFEKGPWQFNGSGTTLVPMETTIFASGDRGVVATGVELAMTGGAGVNEAILAVTLDSSLQSASDLWLQYLHRNIGEFDPLVNIDNSDHASKSVGDTFAGSINADLVSISANGTDWRVVDLLDDTGFVSVDLDSEISSAGYTWAAQTDLDLFIKFQQYDSEGKSVRTFDDITVASGIAPTISSIANQSVDEGGSGTLDLDTPSQTIQLPGEDPLVVNLGSSNFEWRLGPSFAETATITIDEQTAMAQFNWIPTVRMPLFAGDGNERFLAPVTVSVIATDPATGLSSEQTFDVTVTPRGVRGQPLEFVLLADGTLPTGGEKITFEIDWDFSGTFSADETVIGLNGSLVEHVYATTGDYDVVVRAKDGLGTQIGTDIQTTVEIEEFALQTAPDLPSEFGFRRLVYGGTASSDTIEVRLENNPSTDLPEYNFYLSGGSSPSISVPLIADLSGPLLSAIQVVVYGQAGDDDIRIMVPVNADVFGGDGDDIIAVNASSASLVGQAGDDLLVKLDFIESGKSPAFGSDELAGGSGKDILIGGYARDILRGGTGEDLVVSETTAFNTENLFETNFTAIQDEWLSAHTFDDRVKNILGVSHAGFGSRLNGNVFLKPDPPNPNDATVNSDSAPDTITGGAGRDWLIYNADQDQVRELTSENNELDTTPNRSALEVTRSEDVNELGTLRYAIQHANDTAGTNTIELPLDSINVALTSELPAITEAITILAWDSSGAGRSKLEIGVREEIGAVLGAALRFESASSQSHTIEGITIAGADTFFGPGTPMFTDGIVVGVDQGSANDTVDIRHTYISGAEGYGIVLNAGNTAVHRDNRIFDVAGGLVEGAGGPLANFHVNPNNTNELDIQITTTVGKIFDLEIYSYNPNDPQQVPELVDTVTTSAAPAGGIIEFTHAASADLAGRAVFITATEKNGSQDVQTSGYSDQAPTVEILGASPTTGVRGQSLAFDFQATDPFETTSYVYHIDWGDGSALEEIPFTTAQLKFSHVFPDSDTYTISVTAEDSNNNHGRLAATHQITISDYEVQNGDLVFGGTLGLDEVVFIPDSLDPTTIDVLVVKEDGVTVNNSFSVSNVTGDLIVFAQAGNDIIDASGLETTAAELRGDDGNDVLRGGDAADTILGLAGNDTLYGNDGNDEIAGFDGGEGGPLNDSDQIFGGLGNDTLSGDKGTDTVYGGSGNDMIYGDGDPEFENEGAADLLLGEDGADTINGGPGDDQIDGGDGNDLLVGGDGAEGVAGGDDTMIGGLGNDSIEGDNGQDFIIGGQGNDSLVGGDGNDVYIFERTGTEDLGTDQVVEETGADNDPFDILIFEDFGAAVDVDLSDAAEQEVHSELSIDLNGSDVVEIASGSVDFDDTLTGNSRDNVLVGHGGDDQLFGDSSSATANRDFLIGGAGADTLEGLAGDDLIIAGATDYGIPIQIEPHLAVFSEWLAAKTYEDRVDNIIGASGAPDPLPSADQLADSVSVFDDSEIDSITGGSGDDFYFADLDPTIEDVLTDKAIDELVEELDTLPS